MEFIGDTRNTSRVLNAMDFIEKHWNDTYDEYPWRELKNGNYYAIYSVFKGLFAISATPGAFPWDVLPGGLNWRRELDQYLVSQQKTDGSWLCQQWFDATLSTAAAVLSLMRTIVGAPFVTVNSIDATEFPAVALNIFVDSDTGVSGELGILRFWKIRLLPILLISALTITQIPTISGIPRRIRTKMAQVVRYWCG